MILVTAGEMQEMDRQTIETFGIPGKMLMENAGRGATQIFVDHFREKAGRVCILAGKGNNGGDGFVMARYLSQMGLRVEVYLLSLKEGISGDAGWNLHLLNPLKIPIYEIPDVSLFSKYQPHIKQNDVLIDAILGTGLKSDVRGYFKEVIDFINNSNIPVFSVDMPSGLNSDTGEICGKCIQAEITATFGFPKTGHFLYPGRTLTGKLRTVDIGIPNFIIDKVDPFHQLVTPEYLLNYIKERPPESHKGNTGHLLVIAGSPGKTGAVAMTATAAVRSGAGLTTAGIPESLNAIMETLLMEAMTHPLQESKAGYLGKNAASDIIELSKNKQCLAIGPGLGNDHDTKELILTILPDIEPPVVIDADGLNILSENLTVLKKRKSPTILTPHPGEMSRLCGKSTKAIQSDRVNTALNFSKKYGVYTVLKGAGTIIATPYCRIFINPTGNPGMASGGMGDVLTGMIAGFICQKIPLEAACCAGVYLHGMAADTLSFKKGPFGYLASEVMDIIPYEINNLKHKINGTLPDLIV